MKLIREFAEEKVYFYVDVTNYWQNLSTLRANPYWKIPRPRKQRHVVMPTWKPVLALFIRFGSFYLLRFKTIHKC